MKHLIAIIALAVLCGLWVLVQRYISRRDPGQPGVEKHGGCGACPEHDHCATKDCDQHEPRAKA